jgi:hypothetical protein
MRHDTPGEELPSLGVAPSAALIGGASIVISPTKLRNGPPPPGRSRFSTNAAATRASSQGWISSIVS